MSAGPSPTEANGRDPKGRFAAGNHAAKGNPFGRRVNELRRLLYEAVRDDHVKGVIVVLLRKALEGEPWAIKELFDRLLGKPAQALELSGSDGEALGGLTLPVLTTAILDALRNHPEARQSVAKRLVELSAGSSAAPADDGGAGE